jgi:hypothetical protein
MSISVGLLVLRKSIFHASSALHSNDKRDNLTCDQLLRVVQQYKCDTRNYSGESFCKLYVIFRIYCRLILLRKSISSSILARLISWVRRTEVYVIPSVFNLLEDCAPAHKKQGGILTQEFRKYLIHHSGSHAPPPRSTRLIQYCEPRGDSNVPTRSPTFRLM